VILLSQWINVLLLQYNSVAVATNLAPRHHEFRKQARNKHIYFCGFVQKKVQKQARNKDIAQQTYKQGCNKHIALLWIRAKKAHSSMYV
jgi:hypothetical protein